MRNQDFLPGGWHAASFRVRYQESDQMGVVYHSNYLNWFEVGRTEMLRELGCTYQHLETQGVLLPVLSADLRFIRSAKYDDIVVVYTRMTSFTPLRVSFEYEVRRPSGPRMAEDASLEGNSASRNGKGPGDASVGGGFRDAASGELLVSGTTGHAWVSREFKPVRLDRTLPDVFGGIVAALCEERGKI